MSDASSTPQALLRTLLVSDLVSSTRILEKLGDEGAARLFSRHDSLARGLLARHEGQEIDKTDGFLILFRRPISAVLYAIEYHREIAELSRESGVALASRVGIHLAEVMLRENSPQEVARGAKPVEVEGLGKPMAARLMSVAQGGQTLLTRGALEMARRAAVDKLAGERGIRWLEHGLYRFKGVEDPVEVFEVGVEGLAPLAPPPDSEKVKAVPVVEPGGRSGSRFPAWGLPAAVAALLIVLLGWWLLSRPTASSPAERVSATQATTVDRQRIVVLPFENLGPAEDEYFADGITDEITGRLAMVTGLGVISRASAAQYVKGDKDTRTIGEELGVGYLLRGSIRWSARPGGESRVRVTPRLIRVSDDIQVWSPTYDRVIEDIFAVQSEIASAVAAELGLTLLRPETGSTAAGPTQSIEAYQSYLRGQSFRSQPLSEETQLEAVDALERAVELDREFIHAWAALVHVHALVHFNVWDSGGAHLEKARAALERAQELEPENPVVWIGAGYFYYYGLGQYDRAASEFERVAQALPNDTSVRTALAYVHRRQGRVEDAEEELEQALELDPLNSNLLDQIAETYQASRSYRQADDYWLRAIAVAPDQGLLYAHRAENLVRWRGDSGGAREILAAAPGAPSLTRWDRLDFLHLDLLDRHLDRIEIAVSPEKSLKIVTSLLVEGLARRLAGEAETARASFGKAERLARELVEGSPDTPILRSGLALALAFGGRGEPAIAEAEAAVEMVATDAYSGPLRKENLAAVYAWSGEEERAVDLLAELLETSYQRALSRPLLKLHPIWDPLRGNPRFERLISAG